MDEHLIRQKLAQEGSTALAELFSELVPRLEKILHFRIDPRIRSRVDTSDVLQEAFLEISRRVDEYLETPHVSFFVWIRQKTIQTWIDIQREHFREKRDVNREIRFSLTQPNHATSISIAAYLIDELTSPSHAMMQAEEVQQLQSALDSMQEIDREVLALRHFEQLSNLQVAEVLGITPTAASNRYVRAATRLGQIVAELRTRQDGNRGSS